MDASTMTAAAGTPQFLFGLTPTTQHPQNPPGTWISPLDLSEWMAQVSTDESAFGLDHMASRAQLGPPAAARSPPEDQAAFGDRFGTPCVAVGGGSAPTTGYISQSACGHSASDARLALRTQGALVMARLCPPKSSGTRASSDPQAPAQQRLGSPTRALQSGLPLTCTDSADTAGGEVGAAAASMADWHCDGKDQGPNPWRKSRYRRRKKSEATAAGASAPSGMGDAPFLRQTSGQRPSSARTVLRSRGAFVMRELGLGRGAGPTTTLQMPASPFPQVDTGPMTAHAHEQTGGALPVAMTEQETRPQREVQNQPWPECEALMCVPDAWALQPYRFPWAFGPQRSFSDDAEVAYVDTSQLDIGDLTQWEAAAAEQQLLQLVRHQLSLAPPSR